jgi:hypothetical protein
VGVVTRRQREHVFAWAALAAGAAAWFGSQQVGSDLSFAHCGASGGPFVIPLCLVALALAGSGGLLSWRVWKRGEPDPEQGRPFVALVGTLAAALLAIAICYQLLAGLIIPRCFA